MWRSPIGRLRAAGFLEGVSFLILLVIAMPLKYAAGIPEAVSVVGMLHGVLFVLYLITIANALIVRKLTFAGSLLAFIAAFLPFGPFLMDRRLR
jgi:integral membrane protein